MTLLTLHRTPVALQEQYEENYQKKGLFVVPPERADGNIEYKRQVLNLSQPRLRGLATQMCYRLDQGMGRCQYFIGVDDDGRHSLLNYSTVAQSAMILECIARSLNAVVLERVMIQGECHKDDDTSISTPDETSKNTTVRRYEPPVFYREFHQSIQYKGFRLDDTDSDSSEENTTLTESSELLSDDSPSISSFSSMLDLNEPNKVSTQPLHLTSFDTSIKHVTPRKRTFDKADGIATRCEITIQRVETHLLDTSPVSIVDLANRKCTEIQYRERLLSNVSDGICAATEAFALLSTKSHGADSQAPPSSSSPADSNNSSDEQGTSNLNSSNTPDNENQGNSNTPNKSDRDDSSDDDSETPFSPSSGLPSVCETLSSRNIRVAVVGNVDAGKSTLIGTLTTSSLDDGRGSSRTAIMKHRHEIETGRTSTATTHLLGFRHTGESIHGRDAVRVNKRKSEDEIARESYRVVTLMDLAGHEKYLKTTIHGVSAGMADYSLILVNSRQPPTHMTQHHLNLCCSFGIPVIIVFTKVDGCPENAMKTSKEEVYKMLRAPDIGHKPFVVRNEQDIATVMGKMQTLAPVIDTSCVTGEGLDLLRKMLFSLPKRRQHEKKKDRPFEFLIEDVFMNVPGVGAVVSGFVNAGELAVGPTSHVYVGPLDDGTFLRTVAKSAHVARINTTQVTAGQSACLAFALKKDDRQKLRRGMVVLRESPSSTREFDAEICVLKGEGTTIRKSYQAYVHILNVRQSAFARKIEIVNNNAMGLPPSHCAQQDEEDGSIVLRPGSRAKVRFEFVKRPEYIRPGMRMLFRDGRVRGVGIITGIPSIV